MGEAYATSFATNLVSKLAEYLIAPIGRQFGYVLCYKSYIEALEDGVKKLEIEWERVQHSVQEAENDGKPIETNIKNWLESVEEETEKARTLLKRAESAKDACFRGWLPNPVVRHPIGRKVKKISKVIQGLRDESKNSFFLKVYYENTPRGIVEATPSTARFVHKKEDVLASRASLIEDVINAIVDDKVCVIGVYGPGGIGKSKLMEDVERQVRDEQLFNVVATTNVSRNPDPKRIQGEIAYALGLNLMNEETVLGRADRLCKRLEQDSEKKILIILDNLWTKLELKEVGIPCGDNNKARGCKLLLTSRYLDVLSTDMSSDQEFQLSFLNHGEARMLFERTVGDRVYDPQLASLVDGVVRNCGGLPLLIVSVAKRLKRGGLAEWRNALTNVEGSSVKSIVELNYNDLKEERVKSLFLVCALSSVRPSIRDILVYCMSLGLYKTISDTIEKARDGLITDLRRLLDSSLLLGSDGLERFSMHDLFVDTALSMHDKFIDTEWNALVKRQGFGFEEWSKYDLRKCTAMALNYDGIDELPKKLDCPDMRILLLFGPKRFLKMPQSFFGCMEKLQALDIGRLSFTALPSSMELLGNLKSLYLDDCHLEDVTILGKLKGLQFLSFVNSRIARLPKEIGELTKLRFLDLTGCTWLKFIEPGVLGSLVNLEELYMQDCLLRWEAEDEVPRSNASLAEFKNMNKLSTLHITIPRRATLPTSLPFGKLNRHCIQIGTAWDLLIGYKESQTLNLKLDCGNLLVEEWMQRCLEKTENLRLEILQGGNRSIHDLCFEGFQELKHLHVRNSSSFQDIARSTDNYVQCTAFTKLESLVVENLNNLKRICCGCLAPESFNKLKIVKVDKCDKITHLFPMSMLKILSQLEELEISSCHLMQQVVGDAEADEIVEDCTVKSCNLYRLALQNLTTMTSFSKMVNNSMVLFNGQQASFPRLESLTLAELPKLEEIWNSQYPLEVSNLKFLEVLGCTSLLSIIPSNLLIKLQNLEDITIEKCQLIQEVFNLEELTPCENVEILGRLTRLTLHGLPRLEHIWNKSPRGALCFQNLRALKVQNCENLRFLFSSSMAKALVQIKEIEVASCVLMEEIMDMQKEESKEVPTTDTLEFPLLNSLSLLELPNLKTFSHGKHYIHCPSLTNLTISRCPKMMTFASSKARQQSTTSSSGSQQAFDHINSGLSSPSFFNEKVSFPNLEELMLSCMCQLKRIWHDQLHNQSFCKLASLTVEFCENLSNIFPSNSLDKLQNLNKIEVVGCPSLEALFEPTTPSSGNRQKPLVLDALNEMKLLNLPRLTSILNSDCKVTLAPNLMEVNVRLCHSLPYLFSSATAKNLDRLAQLDVSCCNNLRAIIAMEEGKGTTIETLKFQQLCKIKLGDLENLISFCSASCANHLRPLFDEKLAFPKLEELHIEGAKQEDLWNNKILPKSFCRLKILKVKQCHNLINVIPPFMLKRLFHCLESLTIQKCPRLRFLVTISMAKNLGQVQHLSISDCGEMEYIIAKEEEKLGEAVDKIVISRLVTLYLHNMPKLKSFYQGNHISEWPSLKNFTIENCKAVEVILGDANCRKLEGNFPTQQPLLLVKKVEFPNMDTMKISHMDKVEKIWLHDLASNAFNKLKTLVVEYCEKLSSIFSSYTILTRFQNLEELIVTDCGSLEVVFHSQEFNISEARSVSTFQLGNLFLKRLPKMKHVWSGPTQGGLTFGRLQRIEVIECESLKSLFPSLVAKSMTRLESLIVESCGVEEIITEDDGVGTSAGDLFFPQLFNLALIELPKFKSFLRNSHTSRWPLLMYLQVRHCGKMRSFSFPWEIQSCQGTIVGENQPGLFSFEKVIARLQGLLLTREDVVKTPQHYTFANLTGLTLSCYHEERVGFPSEFLLHRFPSLKEFAVECCSFDEMFPEDASGHGGATPCGGLTDVEKPLPALRDLWFLRLKRLCNLRRVCRDGSLMAEVLKQIECLWLEECPSLSIIFPSPISLQRLRELHVEDCAGLVHVVTCSAATSLVNLERLTLRNCGAMEDVVTDGGNGAEEISFPQLRWLILDGLPSLESFSPTNCAFRFPSLGSITVNECPKLNIFCKGALRTPELYRVRLYSDNDYEECWEGDLNTTIQTLST